ncbi:TetR/AcrR family transcriptional regulator [Spirosoma litoris]
MEQQGQDTEQKIKTAARKVFLEQGYEGAKIRQIAREAGVNLAMVNYYFRSKDQLFRSIYQDIFREFMGRMAILLNEETPLEVKIWKIVDRYTDFIMENQQLPLLILAEQRKEGPKFMKELNVKSFINDSYLKKQLQEEAKKGLIRAIDPLQVILTIMGNIIFPIMAQSIVCYVGDMEETSFRQLMETRKQIIPGMIMAYLREGQSLPSQQEPT